MLISINRKKGIQCAEKYLINPIIPDAHWDTHQEPAHGDINPLVPGVCVLNVCQTIFSRRGKISGGK